MRYSSQGRTGRLIADRDEPRAKLRTSLILVSALLSLVMLTAVLIVGATSRPGPSAPTAPVASELTTAPPSPKEAPAEPLHEPEPEPTPLAEFDVENAMAELRAIESFGVREGGSEAEAAAADYIAQRLTDMGYAPTVEEFAIPGGRTSRNVVARSEGLSERVLIIGAHIDSKPPSPGANDNASGCGAVLDVARILASQPVTATVEFVFFGTEEIVGGPDDHHLGSRHRVSLMSDVERQNTAGMLSVDMIGFGSDFHSRTMLRGPQTMSDLVLDQALSSSVPMTFLKDPGSTGWSDHEPFELAGIPVSWIQWRPDPLYHTAEDTSDRIDAEKVRIAGQLVLDICRALDVAELERLLAR